MIGLLYIRRMVMHGKQEEASPTITFEDNKAYSTVSSSDTSVKEFSNGQWCGLIIALPTEVSVTSLTFSCGSTTSIYRLVIYNEAGVNQLRSTYNSNPKSEPTSGTKTYYVKTIYLSVYKDNKEGAFIKDDNDNYIFDGRTYDWTQHGL